MKMAGKQRCQEKAGLVPWADEVRLLHMRRWNAQERAGMPKGNARRHEPEQPSKKSWKHLRPSNWAYSNLVSFQVGSSPNLPSLEIFMNCPYC